MAYIEPRKRKNGTTKYYVHWKEPLTGAAMHEKCDSLDDSKFLLTVLKAHDDLEKAHAAVVNFYGEKYTVSKMVREHIAILTSAAGYTVRRYEGYVKNHLDGALGERAAADVEYRDIMGWVRTMKDKGLKPKTVANVHGLLSSAFNTMAQEKKRPDNPCKGVSLPKDDATEETATFLAAEWERIQKHLSEPYGRLFTFLVFTGLRFSEATALYGRDFELSPTGQPTVKVSRAWRHDKDNRQYLGPPKTPMSRRVVVVDKRLH